MAKKCCGKWKKNNKHCSSCPMEEECETVFKKSNEAENKMMKKAKKVKKSEKTKKTAKDKTKKKKK